MKKTAFALALAAAVAAQIIAAAAPVRAEIAPENMNQGLGLMAQSLPSMNNLLSPSSPNLPPDLGGLQLKPLAPINPALLFLFKAELTSQLFVANTGNPSVKVVWCLVRNTGFVNSGPCWTFLRIQRRGTSIPLQGYVLTNVAAGGHQWIGVLVYAPYGFTRIFSYADATHIVPEYNEFNNWDSIP